MRICSRETKLLENIVFSVCLSVFVFAFWRRLSFCVDLGDESLYSALPIRFFKNNTPYIDELLLVQNAGILLQPLVWLYSLFQPKLEGIVFYFRTIYFVLAIMSGILPYLFLRKFMDFWAAVWAAVLVVSFVPFSIPSVSYNTLSSFFLVASLVCLSISFQESNTRSEVSKERLANLDNYFVFGVIFLLFGMFVYPTLYVVGVFMIPTVIGHRWKKHGLDVTNKIVLLGCFLVAVLAVYIIFSFVGVPRIREMLQYTMSMQVHMRSKEKIVKMAEQLWANRLFYGPALLVFVLVPLLMRVRFLSSLVMLLLTYFCYTFSLVDGLISHHVMVLFSILPFLFLFSKKMRDYARENLSIVFLLAGAIFFGFCYWWTSGNGIYNLPLGSLGAVLVFFILLSHRQKECRSSSSIAFLVMLLCISQLSVFWMQHYGDDEISVLSATVEVGPFRGIKTTEEKKQFLHELQSDLSGVAAGANTIAGFDSATVVYMASELLPFTPTVWTYFSTQLPSDRSILVNYYKRNGKKPNILVWMREIPVMKGVVLKEGPEENELKRFLVNGRAKTLVDRTWYTIYRID